MNSVFDIKTVPFSHYGSWMAFSIPRGEESLFLRNFHGGSNNVFPLLPLLDGAAVAAEITARPWALELRRPEGRIEICFESAGAVRLRGRGLGLQLGNRHLIYSEAPNRFVINQRPALRRYGVELLRGRFEIRRLVPDQPVFPLVAVISPDERGEWEAALDEFLSTWVRPARAPFDSVAAAARKAFEEFRATLPVGRPEDERAADLAVYINWSCTVAPCGLIRRPTVFMSKNRMCNVWSWDQCFNALALARGQPALAMDQMLTLVDHQDEFGAYPDSINDVVLHFNFSKPPIHGWAFRELLARMPERPPRAVMETLLRSLGRQANWWMTHRTTGAECRAPSVGGRPRADTDDGARPFESCLPYYLHGNDSGWDNSTMFGQGVPLIAPDLAAYLILQMEALSELAAELGKAAASAKWARRADALYRDLMRELWRGDHFIARRLEDGARVESRSLIHWLPILLGERLPPEARDHLERGIRGHLTEWGLATERPDSPRYHEDGYWQGPIWAPSTYLVVSGLRRCGFHELADEIAGRFRALCRRSGFAENFNALTGEPLRDPAYTWTASVFLLLSEPGTGKDAK